MCGHVALLFVVEFCTHGLGLFSCAVNVQHIARDYVSNGITSIGYGDVIVHYQVPLTWSYGRNIHLLVCHVPSAKYVVVPQPIINSAMPTKMISPSMTQADMTKRVLKHSKTTSCTRFTGVVVV